MDAEALEAERGYQVIDDQDDLNVGGVAGGADGVEVALPELAEAAFLRPLAAPDRPHVVALERRAELVDILGREACEGHGQIEAQGHVVVAVRETVELLVRLRSALAEQDLAVLEGGGVD